MAKFSEIIGGIAKDLVQVQLVSDLSSMEALSHYKDDALWKNLDIPRFTLSNINLKLKFAISESIVLERTDSSVNHVESEWFSALNGEVLDEILSSDTGMTASEKKLIKNEFVRISSARDKPNLDIENVLNSKTNTTVSKSIKYLMDIYKKLPQEITKKMPAATSFNKIANNKVAAIFERRMPALKKVASAEVAAETNLDIIVEKAALENINSEQIHEISLNITPDFIKLVQDEAVK